MGESEREVEKERCCFSEMQALKHKVEALNQLKRMEWKWKWAYLKLKPITIFIVGIVVGPISFIGSGALNERVLIKHRI